MAQSQLSGYTCLIASLIDLYKLLGIRLASYTTAIAIYIPPIARHVDVMDRHVVPI